MKIIKRAYLYIVSNKIKSILLFCTVFILSNLLISAIVIQSASYKLEQLFQQRIGFKVFISDYNETINMNILDNIDEDYEYRNYIYETIIQEFPCNYSSVSIKSISLQNQNGSSFYTEGVNKSLFYELYENYITITDGRTFTQDELNSGANVMILSNELNKGRFFTDETQSFKIGDVIPFTIKDGQEIKTVDVEIIGLFDINDSLSLENSYDMMTKSFMPYKTITRLNEMADENNYQRIQMYFNLSSNELFEQFLIRANELINTTQMHLYRSDAEFKTVQKPLLATRSLAEKYVLISSVTLIFALSFIVFLFLKERTHEIAIYRALGERNIKIILQILVEMLSISVLAVTLSFYSGTKIGNTIAENMLRIQIQEDAKSEVNYLNPEGLDLEGLIEIYEFNIDTETLLIIAAFTSLVLISSTVIPIIYIMKISSKKILT